LTGNVGVLGCRVTGAGGNDEVLDRGIETGGGALPKTPTFPVNPDGVEQLHRYQRSGTGSSKRARTKNVEGRDLDLCLVRSTLANMP
jgi:hypothetical protein